jgi:hypothetical protein
MSAADLQLKRAIQIVSLNQELSNKTNNRANERITKTPRWPMQD